MGGVLTHVGLGLAAALIVYFIQFKLEYSLSIFIGNLLPDVIKFGFTAIKQGTLAVFSVEFDSFFWFLADVTSSYTFWFTIGFFVFALAWFFYHFHYIKQKKMNEYDELYLFLLAGIIIHLIADALFIETSPWL